SVHPFMTGTLHVSSNGTPKTKPPPADTVPPTAFVQIRDKKIKTVLKHKALTISLEVNEQSTFVVTAGAGKTKLGGATYRNANGVIASAKLRLTKAGRTLLARSRKVTVKVKIAVTDAAGNRSAGSATRKLS